MDMELIKSIMFSMGNLSFQRDKENFIDINEYNRLEKNLYLLFDGNPNIQKEILNVKNECVNINDMFDLLKDYSTVMIMNILSEKYNYSYYCTLCNYFYMMGYLKQLYFNDYIDEYYNAVLDIIVNHKELFYNENEMRYYYNYVLSNKNDFNSIFKMMDYLTNVIWIYSKYKSDFKKELEIEKQEYF